nr:MULTISPECIES: CHASE4 domain-containing protein [unclassified Limnothrix]
MKSASSEGEQVRRGFRQLVVTILLVSGLLYTGVASVLLNTITSLEQRTIEEHTNRFTRLLYRRSAQLLPSACDYGYWDATHQFLRQPNEDFIRNNFSPTNYQSFDLTIMGVVGRDGKIRYARERQVSNQSGSTANDRYHEPSTTLTYFLQSLPKGFQSNPDQKRLAGVVAIDNDLLSIAICSIPNPQKPDQVDGWFVMGQRLDARLLQDLSQLVPGALEIKVSRHSNNLPLYGAFDFTGQARRNQRTEVTDSSRNLVGYRYLVDVYGKPSAIARVTITRTLHQHSLYGLLSIGGILVLLSLGFISLAWQALQQALQNLDERDRAEAALIESATQNLDRETYRARIMELELILQDLRASQAQLIHSAKMESLGKMVAGIAHEVNNPVSFIQGNLRHLKKYQQDLCDLIRLYQKYYPVAYDEILDRSREVDLAFILEDSDRVIQSIDRGADRIYRIVNALRNFSRLDESDLKSVDLHAGIDSTIELLDHALEERSFRPAIAIERVYGELPLVECYARQLNQVFMHLLMNSIDSLDETMKKHYQRIHGKPADSAPSTPTTAPVILGAEPGTEIDLSNSEPIDGGSYRSPVLKTSADLPAKAPRNSGQPMSQSKLENAGIGNLNSENASTSNNANNTNNNRRNRGASFAEQLRSKLQTFDANGSGFEAAKAPLQPTITIRTKVDLNRWVLISIADNGLGIDKQVQSRLFDPFFTTKPVGQGAGLGLFISHQIITQHGGQLRCISEPDQGSEFIILLPLKQIRETKPQEELAMKLRFNQLQRGLSHSHDRSPHLASAPVVSGTEEEASKG